MDKKILDQQSQHWENNFRSKPEMFGLEPSNAAIRTLKNFKEKKITKIVELGAGLGRDTIFFAKNNIKVEALDYSEKAVTSIKKKIKELLDGFSNINIDRFNEGDFPRKLFIVQNQKK